MAHVEQIPGFIAELIRAANEINRLGPFEIKRLLDRSVITIRELRDEVGIAPDPLVFDITIDLQTTAAGLMQGKRSLDDAKAALLDAADMLRTIKIVLDGKE